MLSSASTMYAHRDDAFSARCPLLRMRVPQVNESSHLNIVGNLIPPTDQSPAYPGPTIAGGRAGGLDGEVD